MKRLLAHLAILGTAAFGADPKIAKDLANAKPGKPVDVVIAFARGAAETGKGKVEKMGGQLKADLKLIRSAVFSVHGNALEELAADPDIDYIAPDRDVHPMLDSAAAAVGATAAFQSGLDGRGIGIAVIDSGIAGLADLGNRVVHQQWFRVKGGIDHYGHGVHVAGIVAGDGAGSGGRFRGIAPGARIVSLQVLDDRGQGRDSNVIAAIERAIELRAAYNIRILNLSIGRPVYESYTIDPLCRAVEAAWKAGIVVVVAAGNEGRNGDGGYGTITSPATIPTSSLSAP